MTITFGFLILILIWFTHHWSIQIQWRRAVDGQPFAGIETVEANRDFA
jgi:hypothetical protein